MNKKEEEQEEKPAEEVKEEREEPAVALAEVPSEYEIVYKTPDGVFREKDYLVWMGNLLLEVKQSLVG